MKRSVVAFHPAVDVLTVCLNSGIHESRKALLRKHSIVDCVEKPKGGDNMSIQVIPPTGKLIDRHRQENALADLSVMEKMLEQQLKSNEETAEAMRENNELLRSIADALKA